MVRYYLFLINVYVAAYYVVLKSIFEMTQTIQHVNNGQST